MPLFNLSSAESIISTICLFVAYCFSVTITGATQAFVARKCGDDTASDEGYESLNPAQHVDPIGAFLLVIFGFGWGRQIPIDPFRISHRFHKLKVFLVYGTEALTSMLLAIIALFVLVFSLKSPAFRLALEMFRTGGYAPTKLFVSTFPELSSLNVVASLMLFSLVFFNVFITTYSVILNGIKYILARGQIHGHAYMEYADYIMLFGPLIFLILFAEPLRIFILQNIFFVAYALGYFLHIL